MASNFNGDLQAALILLIALLVRGFVPDEVITSETLTRLNDLPIEVLRSMDRVFGVGMEM